MKLSEKWLRQEWARQALHSNFSDSLYGPMKLLLIITLPCEVDYTRLGDAKG